MAQIRADVVRFDRPDGGVDYHDPLLARVRRFDTADPPEAALRAALLLEGPEIARLRQAAYTALVSAEPRQVCWTEDAPPPAIWAQAPALPPEVAAPWHAPEPWRRLAEERLAGRRRLVLPGFLGEPAALAARDALLEGAWIRQETAHIAADRADLAQMAPPLAALDVLLRSPVLRDLLGAALGVGLPDRLQMNAWRLGPGDRIRAHPDGHRYAATFALGLNPGWAARDGGAIAFGEPAPGGLAVTERWLPFLGDLCCFVPDHDTWHVVEPPSRPRITVSGWWCL